MTLKHSPSGDLGTRAPFFRLFSTEGQAWSLQDCAGPNGLLIMFICNHCPYVKAINNKLIRDALELQNLGIKCAAINPNDSETYPEDSLDNMRMVARDLAYPFPYLIDETQEVAKAYGAVCTPDFFGYNSIFELQYRGRLDASGASEQSRVVRRDLFLAMKQIAETGLGPEHQVPSMGCSIKWRE